MSQGMAKAGRKLGDDADPRRGLYDHASSVAFARRHDRSGVQIFGVDRVYRMGDPVSKEIEGRI